VVRPEEPRDFTEIADVVRAAFGDHGTQVAAFVERIRASEQYVPELALVALDDSGVVGHVMLSFVGIENATREQLLVLTPMSVRPDRQRRGIGSSLIEAVLSRAEQAGEPAVLVEGIPAYYPRFGFERARALGFVAPEETPDEAFMVKRLSGWQPGLAGRVVYPASYEALVS
jgi:putative acetyltransferase